MYWPGYRAGTVAPDQVRIDAVHGPPRDVAGRGPEHNQDGNSCGQTHSGIGEGPSIRTPSAPTATASEVSFPGHDDHPVGDGITPAPNLWTHRGELQVEAIPSWLEPPGTAAVWTSVNEPSRLMTYAFTDEPRPTWT